jgi:hypothetical protein
VASAENLARWRRELKQLSETIMNDREEFRTWFEEANDYRAEGDEANKCLQEIKKDERRYWQLISQLPTVDDFTDEEVEKKTKERRRFSILLQKLLLYTFGSSVRLRSLSFSQSIRANKHGETKHGFRSDF